MRISKGHNGKIIWKKWKDSSECTEEEILSANLRELQSNEIVLDYDTEETLQKGLDKLRSENVKFNYYKHGNEGGHIHLYFIDKFPITPQFRKHVIEIYGADTSKQNGLIAWEDKPHWKTGKIKESIESTGIFNSIRPEWIDTFEKIEINKPITNTDNLFCEKAEFYLINPVSKTENAEKNNKLFKNLAIYVIQTRGDTPESESLLKAIAEINNHNKIEMRGWIDQYREKKITEYNCAELKKWENKHELKSVSCNCYLNTPQFEDCLKILANFDDYLNLAEEFIKKQPIHYDNALLWWLWNNEKGCWEIVDEIDLFNKLDDVLQKNDGAKTIKQRGNIIEALKRQARRNKPTPIDINYIQFKKQLVSLNTNEILESSPKFFSTNPIPWAVANSEDTPTMDRIFEEWVGKDYVQTLYGIIAYCLYQGQPLERIFFFYGKGSNGKSKFLEIITNFVGENNSCASDLDLLATQRFESSNLYKKLICVVGETDFKILEKSQFLKRLTGADLMRYEFKNKNTFTGKSYTKVLISTNNLPVTQDKTTGFYRRPLVISFPNQFTEEKDILSQIPPIEYNNLAKKLIRVLKELLTKRRFYNEGSIEDRTKRYEKLSNPLISFLEERCEKDTFGKISFSEFYSRFVIYLTERKYRIQSKKEVGSLLEREGIERKTKNYDKSDGTKGSFYEIRGLKFKDLSEFQTHPLEPHVQEPKNRTEHQNKIVEFDNKGNGTSSMLDNNSSED